MFFRNRAAQSSVRRVPLPHPRSWFLASITGLATAALAFFRGGGGWTSYFAACALIAAVYSYRRFRFSALARQPGPVKVIPFVDTTHGKLSIDDVMSEVRTALDRVNLQSPSAVAGEVSTVKLLDVVRTTANEAKTPLAATAGLLQGMVVTHAYQVTGAIRTRPGVDPLGLTVQVATLPSAYSRYQTYWGSDWSRIAEQAAAFVGAYVLPRSRLCRQPPWDGWYGLSLPANLFDEYLQATRLRLDGRLEEALDRFHRALRLDPLNPHLRFALGGIQKRLGLNIDALATYAAVLVLEAWSDRRLYRRFQAILAPHVDVLPRRLSASPHRRALMIARYNMATAFGTGELLARQWVIRPQAAADGSTERDRERLRLRGLLGPWVSHYVDGFVEWLGDPLLAGVRKNRSLQETLNEIEQDTPKLQLLFQYIAWEEHVSMAHDYSWRGGRRRVGLPVSQATLRIDLLWAALRLAWTWHEVVPGGLRSRSEGLGRNKWTMPSDLQQLFEEGAWPPDAHWLRAQLEGSMKRGWLRRLNYADYYNAASVVSICLLPKAAAAPTGKSRRLSVSAQQRRAVERSRLEDRHRQVRPGITSLAIHYLERAMHRTQSGFLATRWDWVKSGDPDLAGLRPEDEFVRFETEYLPSYSAPVRRPTEVLRMQLAHHNVAVVAAYSALRAEFWRSLKVDHSRVVDTYSGKLLSEERRSWEMVCRTAADIRHWPTRLRLINAGQRLAEELGVSFRGTPFPDFQDDPLADTLPEDARRSQQAILSAIFRRNAALEQLHRDLSQELKGGAANDEPNALRGLIPTAHVLHADVSDACERHRRQWELLASWLEAVLRDEEPDTAYARFLASAGARFSAMDARSGDRRRPKLESAKGSAAAVLMDRSGEPHGSGISRGRRRNR